MHYTIFTVKINTKFAGLSMNEREIIIDWIQFTSKSDSPQAVITKILKLKVDYFSELNRGSMGYRKQLVYNNISVLYDGNKDMGVHVVMSGQGCRHYETFYPLINLIYTMNRYKCESTRIDLALDDKAGDFIPLDTIVDDGINGRYVSRWRTNLETTERDSNANMLGRTIAFGKRVSNAYLRVYDKALEQGVEGPWVRLELELKKANALEVQRTITETNSGELMCGILRNYIRFVIPNEVDTNKSRWLTSPYWDKLLGGAEKVMLTRKAEEKTLDDKKLWLENQVGATLALVALADGSIDFIYDLIKESSANLKEKHLIMLSNFERQEREREELLDSYTKNKGDNGNGK